MLDIMVSPAERDFLTDQDQTWRNTPQAGPSEQDEKLLTSGKHESCTTSNKSLQRRTVETLKKKLTARVLPMTRNTTMNGDNNSNALTETTDKADDVHRNTSCATNPLLPASVASSLKLKDELKCSKQTTSKTVKARSSKKEQGKKRSAIKHENKELETPAKRPKPLILPATLKECKPEPGIAPSSCSSQTSAPSTSQLQGQTSPEPRLMSENLATMSLLSASECHLATLQDEDGDTPLHIAIAQSNLGLTGYLIQLMSLAGLKVDIYNNLKQTPLHLAVITQQYLVVRALMGAGANVNLPDRNGQTALHLACQRSDLQCLQELLRAQNPEIADCEAGNFEGFKPLHLAVFVGSVELINCLVENGADINCKDGKSGRAPLHHAVETDNLEVISTLVRLGAKVNAHALSGCTPLQIASGRGMDKITRILSKNTTDDATQKQDPSWHHTGAYS